MAICIPNSLLTLTKRPNIHHSRNTPSFAQDLNVLELVLDHSDQPSAKNLKLCNKELKRKCWLLTKKLKLNLFTPEPLLKNLLVSSELPSLEVLIIDGVRCVTDALLSKIIHKQRGLVQISARYCFNLSKKDWNDSIEPQVDVKGCWKLASPDSAMLPEDVLEAQVLALKMSEDRTSEGFLKAYDFVIPELKSSTESMPTISISNCFEYCVGCSKCWYSEVLSSTSAMTFLVKVMNEKRRDTTKYFLWSFKIITLEPARKCIWMASNIHEVHPSIANLYFLQGGGKLTDINI